MLMYAMTLEGLREQIASLGGSRKIDPLLRFYIEHETQLVIDDARKADRDLRLDMAEALAELDAKTEELSRIVHAAVGKVQRMMVDAPWPKPTAGGEPIPTEDYFTAGDEPATAGMTAWDLRKHVSRDPEGQRAKMTVLDEKIEKMVLEKQAARAARMIWERAGHRAALSDLLAEAFIAGVRHAHENGFPVPRGPDGL